jgi:hypothetical protein
VTPLNIEKKSQAASSVTSLGTRLIAHLQSFIRGHTKTVGL